MNIRHLDPSPETVHWGYFDGSLPPQLTIDSGERVTISSVSGTRELMPAPRSRFHLPCRQSMRGLRPSTGRTC
jgi:hypothetical protein